MLVLCSGITGLSGNLHQQRHRREPAVANRIVRVSFVFPTAAGAQVTLQIEGGSSGGGGGYGGGGGDNEGRRGMEGGRQEVSRVSSLQAGMSQACMVLVHQLNRATLVIQPASLAWLFLHLPPDFPS